MLSPKATKYIAIVIILLMVISTVTAFIGSTIAL